MSASEIQAMLAAVVETTVTALLDRLGFEPKPKPQPKPQSKREPKPARELSDVERVQRDFERLRSYGVADYRGEGTYDRETGRLELRVRR